ncbi:hypothetical protein L1987_08998 [Smallanthus sonchifolius]|uniref:Uncharacterized protein n=1 Tax=Smallanthus sonchifolius TaxID=185202 RepID=A0ACB9JM93_9ASTR|nr:hypothetical protein L1987_08998 [Smallanthus sonchifolius]
MRSGIILFDLTRVLEELVFNSLYAGATKVPQRLESSQHMLSSMGPSILRLVCTSLSLMMSRWELLKLALMSSMAYLTLAVPNACLNIRLKKYPELQLLAVMMSMVPGRGSHASCAFKSYELLNILEFNSTQKRMSVIVRDDEGKLLLLCKGV